MESGLLMVLGAICILAAAGVSAWQAVELRRWRGEVQKLKARLAEIEAESTSVERTLRFERAAARTYAREVRAYVHQCRHDLASNLNVASGFLELISLKDAAPKFDSARMDQIKRSIEALAKVRETMAMMPAGLPELLLNGDLVQGKAAGAGEREAPADGERHG